MIIITGYSTVNRLWKRYNWALLTTWKPFKDIEEMEKLLERALNEAELEKAAQASGNSVLWSAEPKCSAWLPPRKNSQENITVLIRKLNGRGGPSLHSVSHRSKRPFLAFNCGAFTETLLESELFGHEKGSFTGAAGRKKGIFELAHNGTLFLDEIDSASQAIQIKLLRVLETGEFLRVGGEEICKVDVRVIAATNTDLVARVEENKFREDLFYRLDVASLHIPPLRERAEDIPLLINYFLEKETISRDIPAKRFSDEAMVILQRHTGRNIRELANTVAQAVLLSKGPIIFPEDYIPDQAASPEPAGKPAQTAAGSNLGEAPAQLRKCCLPATRLKSRAHGAA